MELTNPAPAVVGDPEIDGEVRFDGSFIYRHDGVSWKRAPITPVAW